MFSEKNIKKHYFPMIFPCFPDGFPMFSLPTVAPSARGGESPALGRSGSVASIASRKRCCETNWRWDQNLGSFNGLL
jgi:hypothetical protein